MKQSVKAYSATQKQSGIIRLRLDPKPLKLETKEYYKITIHKFIPVYLQILQVIAMQSEENSLTSNLYFCMG